MSILITLTTICYLLGTFAYIAYLFYQKDNLQKAGQWLLLAGFMVQTATIAYAFIAAGQIPVRNLQETLSLAAWAMAGFFLLFQYKFRLKILGVYAAPLITLIMVLAASMPPEPARTNTLFNSIWLISHVVVIFTGEAAFALACGVGILYLVQEHALKTKNYGFFFRRLPDLELLDTTGYACIFFGFTLLTIGLVAGFVYAKSTWGRFWGWDPKEVWSGISWLLYAALLHGRISLGWRGRKAAVMAIIGFAIIIFTFLGVNLLLKGHHGQFTPL